MPVGAISKDIKHDLRALHLNDKLDSLLDRVQFVVSDCDFGARVVPQTNTIYLSPCLFPGSTPSSAAIESALFELVNLSQRREFNALVDRIQLSELNPDEFVEEFERIEYRTARICEEILKREIPPSHWNEYPIIYTTKSFPLHYFLQQLSGHSDKIYRTYKNCFNKNQPYRGTWITPSGKKDREILSQLLDLKIGSETSETNFGKEAGSMYQRLRSALENNPAYGHLLPYIEKIDQAAHSSPLPPSQKSPR